MSDLPNGPLLEATVPNVLAAIFQYCHIPRLAEPMGDEGHFLGTHRRLTANSGLVEFSHSYQLRLVHLRPLRPYQPYIPIVNDAVQDVKRY